MWTLGCSRTASNGGGFRTRPYDRITNGPMEELVNTIQTLELPACGF